ncbi:unnamed protein product [Merluccius merluccius]
MSLVLVLPKKRSGQDGFLFLDRIIASHLFDSKVTFEASAHFVMFFRDSPPSVARLRRAVVGQRRCACAVVLGCGSSPPGCGSSLPAWLQPEVCQPEEPVGKRWDK